MAPRVSCLDTLRAPPVDVQDQVVTLVESVPIPMRGVLMSAVLDDRLNDAAFLLTHTDEFMDFDRIFREASYVDKCK